LILELNLIMINHRMKKVKAFFYVFLKSLFPNKKYYQKIAHTPFSFSFKYLISLMFFINLILIIILSSFYSPNKIRKTLEATIASLENYPQELVISIQNNNLFTTLDRPYFFWLKDNNRPQLILVIDQSADEKKIEIYKSKFLITATHLVYQKEGKYQSLPLSFLNNQYIDKTRVNQLKALILKINSRLLLYYFLGLISLFFLLFSFSLLINLFYLFFVSLAVFVFFKYLQKRHFHFSKVYQISFHAATFPYLLDYLLLTFPKSIKILPLFPSTFTRLFPLLFLIILTLFTTVGVLEAYSHPTSSHNSHPKKQKIG